MEMAPPTTPLRRSNVFRTPLEVPINNDDEEDRRLSRRRTFFEDTDNSISESSIEDNTNLQNFLKIYQENKISKENAWNVGLIDTFTHMISKHNKMMKNFQIVGSALEASSKVYGLRVDSVHMDTVRMTAGLSRQKATSRINDQSIIEQNNENDINDNQPPDRTDRPQAKKKKTRRQVNTVTTNVDTINGKLETVPFTDPVFAKLNSVVGNLYSTNRLLYSILPTDNSQLILRSDYPAWDFTDAVELPEFDEDILGELPLNILMGELEEFKDHHVLRARNGGYKILNTPADDDDESDVLPESRKSFNHSAVAFDINAEIEPINTQPDFLNVDIDNHFEDDLTIEDRFAIEACRGLRRPPVLIENLGPLDSSSSILEYSYRPLDNISQYWAGPSHWKFKKLSIGGQPVNRLTIEGGTAHKTKKKRVVKKTLKNKLQEIKFDEDDIFLEPLDTMNNIRHVNYKRWDSKKLNLPTNYNLDRNCLNCFKYAQSLSVNDNEIEGTSDDIPSSSYEYNNAVDRDYCPNNNDVDTDDANVQLEHDNENIENDLNATIAAISHQFEGAPNKVGKIFIPFSTRAKIVDMKRLKISCLDIINETADSNNNPISDEIVRKLSKTHVEKYKIGAVSFNGLYSDLPKKISQSMTENLSTATAFYSILHLANDYNLRLVQQEDLKDFQILRIE